MLLLLPVVVACNKPIDNKSIAQLGSNWNNGSNAGTFYWNLNNSVSNRNRNISSQLVNAQNRGVLQNIPVLYKTEII